MGCKYPSNRLYVAHSKFVHTTPTESILPQSELSCAVLWTELLCNSMGLIILAWPIYKVSRYGLIFFSLVKLPCNCWTKLQSTTSSPPFLSLLFVSFIIIIIIIIIIYVDSLMSSCTSYI